ncbi:hypothetical protein ABZ585_41855, partial [Streptomyces vietnamensis]
MPRRVPAAFADRTSTSSVRGRTGPRPRRRWRTTAVGAVVAGAVLSGAATAPATAAPYDTGHGDPALRKALADLVAAPGGPPGALAVLSRGGLRQVNPGGPAEG